MNSYFKFPAESDLGIGIQYIEFDDDCWPIRQAECYGDRWFNSSHRYHQELGGMSLCDQQLTQAGMEINIQKILENCSLDKPKLLPITKSVLIVGISR
jgi:hypothetical protein